ncbi:hypothetical protein [uncultured Pantoea sp.]|uniref:hypothetical protein n=1 Tax=uncultured Pantoea sp. TaxID=218084 RepID=UPI002590EE00|nr:hypothetical protein [uncultured Pantoea sp.]
MSDEKRRCEVTAFHRIKEGYFIKFAPIKFLDESNQPYVAEQAIVELDGGEVVTVNPNQIKFIN